MDKESWESEKEKPTVVDMFRELPEDEDIHSWIAFDGFGQICGVDRQLD